MSEFDFLNDRERAALQQLADIKDMSKEAVMRSALRTYQFIDSYLRQDMEIAFRKPNGEYIRPLHSPKKGSE